jgi:hypothetical protein
MALGREKRTNAGKAPQRVDNAALDTLLPSGRPEASKKAVSKAWSVFVRAFYSQ